jgi:hypothetical protein
MVQSSPLSRRRLAGGALTVVSPDKTEESGFSYFEQGLSAAVRFMCKHILVTPLGNRLLHARQA